jgi:hypothetical protein
VRAGDGAHEEDDSHHHQAGCGDRRYAADGTVGLRVDDRPAGADEDQEERAQQLREQTPPLVFWVVEVPGLAELQLQERMTSSQAFGRTARGRRALPRLLSHVPRSLSKTVTDPGAALPPV